MRSLPHDRRSAVKFVMAAVAALVMPVAFAASTSQASVILLGSGTPIPVPERSGPSVAIVVNGKAYLFDAGAGVVRRAAAAAAKYQIPALEPASLTRLFLTHLHSDHTLGYADLILTPWVVGRVEPLEVYGPKGTQAMTDHLKEAYSEDISVRTEGLEHLNLGGLQVHVHEIEPGLIYRDENISVRAIPVRHGSWKSAFGYAVNAAGRKIVISGDTSPSTAIADACDGCDVLIHEVYSADRFAGLPPEAKRYHSSFHTSTRELAAIANQSKPKLLILYHQLFFGPEQGVDLVGEIHRTYPGAVVSGEDLGIY